MDLTFRWRAFDELSPAELHALLQLRSRVFVVEQQCVFLEVDGRDPDAFHLLGYTTRRLNGDASAHDPGAGPSARALAAGDTHLAACARVFAPGVRHAEASIGRVVTHPAVRGEGTGRALMRAAIAEVESRWPGIAIRLEAQRYLERFYESFGFAVAGAPYLEDDIPHIPMRRGA